MSEQAHAIAEQYGPYALSTVQIILLLLGKRSGVRVAEQVYKKIHHFQTPTIRDLTSIQGVTKQQAARVLASLVLKERLPETRNMCASLQSPEEVYAHMQHIASFSQEHLYGIYLNSQKQVISEHLLFKGTADAMTVHPRDVFRHAFVDNATSLILVHNHPSGNCLPSDHDLLFTEQIIHAGKLLGTPLLDHVIVGKGFWSYVRGKTTNT